LWCLLMNGQALRMKGIYGLENQEIGLKYSEKVKLFRGLVTFYVTLNSRPDKNLSIGTALAQILAMLCPQNPVETSYLALYRPTQLHH
jgi:hypothetical protein